MEREKSPMVRNAEKLVVEMMARRDASHDASHAFRVRDLAFSLAKEECLDLDPSSNGDLEIVELAALLHDIGDYKYTKDCVEDTSIVEKFLMEQGLEESKMEKILAIIERMGFSKEVSQRPVSDSFLEFRIVQDADRLDAIGAIGIARCFTYGGSKSQVLHDPEILPRQDLSKEDYMNKNGKQTTINHFHEKLLKLKDLMKTKAGKRRAEKRHKFMQDFLAEFCEEWSGRA
ncbi:uncharacterized protein [Typha angustifolia]|uniref:uncharacterized protein isoform X1 n=1 Tax=Typha angustifolia TaxID=59011 RepID=UPI003C2F4FCE